MSTNLTEAIILGLTLKLVLALNEYGLNPEEWMIAEALSSQHLMLVHRDDSEFRLIGEITQGRWKSLQVVSL
jgi:predicted nucleic acid-binding protein